METGARSYRRHGAVADGQGFPPCPSDARTTTGVDRQHPEPPRLKKAGKVAIAGATFQNPFAGRRHGQD
jgi:hypothetical protein